MSGTLDFLEVETRKHIDEVMRRHRAELEPHFKILCDIAATRPSPRLIVTQEQWDAFSRSTPTVVDLP